LTNGKEVVRFGELGGKLMIDYKIKGHEFSKIIEDYYDGFGQQRG
jgi:hypothetical protein